MNKPPDLFSNKKTLPSPGETQGPPHAQHQVRELSTVISTVCQDHGVKGRRPAGVWEQSRERLRAVTS